MYWFLLSLGSALSKSLADVSNKRVMAKMEKTAVASLDENSTGITEKQIKTIKKTAEITAGCVARGLVALTALAVVWWQGVPAIGPGFWKAMLISGAINSVTTFLILRALNIGELSLVAPILALSPVFLLATSPIINNQFPSFWGLIGILLSVSGIYTMKVKEKKLGWIEPIKALWRSKGVKEALLVSFLYSISANYDSIGANSSSPFFYIFAVNLLIFALFLMPAMSRKGFLRSARENFKGLAMVSVFMTGEVGFQFSAFQVAIVPYVIAVKRTSALFSVLWGKQFFKEEEFKHRFIGAIIVVAGLALIKLLG